MIVFTLLLSLVGCGDTGKVEPDEFAGVREFSIGELSIPTEVAKDSQPKTLEIAGKLPRGEEVVLTLTLLPPTDTRKFVLFRLRSNEGGREVTIQAHTTKIVKVGDKT